MDSIVTNRDTIVIPIETAIALYKKGRLDGAVLANCLPKEVIERECPEVLRDTGAIAYVSELLKTV